MLKWISKYADIIGTGLGLIITVVVFVVWLAVGPLMDYNSNWWLIIGTYTGLVGFVDGFVMREVYFSITEYEESKLFDLLEETRELISKAGIPLELPEIRENQTISFKISKAINYVCSSQWAVLVSVVSVVVLLLVATAMKWTVTGQLICNTPTMIIEGFFLLILLQAHGWADEKRRKVFYQLKTSREMLYRFVLKRCN
ncbi:unnamed protein product [Ambrosiozyma monospora]|uniref:Unnamed protein product n=1 Tax=Ambrosiozyma monospora TaxID=43982 RepID=A0ACB5TJT5_AMBMO|nr:unnamed protein product [Ambrosiozyma monospora]